MLWSVRRQLGFVMKRSSTCSDVAIGPSGSRRPVDAIGGVGERSRMLSLLSSLGVTGGSGMEEGVWMRWPLELLRSLEEVGVSVMLLDGERTAAAAFSYAFSKELCGVPTDSSWIAVTWVKLLMLLLMLLLTPSVEIPPSSTDFLQKQERITIKDHHTFSKT